MQKLFLALGILFGLIVFSLPVVREYIGITFLELTTDNSIIKVIKSDKSADVFLVPSEAVITNQNGQHAIYRLRGNLLSNPQEDIVEVIILSENDGKVEIQTDQIAERDRLLINKETYQKYKANR